MDRLTHRTHADLLDQVADSQAEADHVRAVLGQPGVVDLCAACGYPCRITQRLVWSGSVVRHAGCVERLTEADLDARLADKRNHPARPDTSPRTWPSCCGSCADGRRPCHTPAACQISAEPDAPRPMARAGDLLRVIVLVLLSWAAVAAVVIAWSMFC